MSDCVNKTWDHGAFVAPSTGATPGSALSPGAGVLLPRDAAPAARRGVMLAVCDDDPFVRAAALAAARTTVAEGEVVARDDAGARLVGVHGLDGVVACPLRRRAAVPAAWAAYVSPSNRSALAFADTAPTAAGALPVLLYVFRDRLAATLHALHRCVAWPLVLVCDERGPRFESLCADDWLLRAGLTPREADVLALLAARRTNDEIAATLVVSPTTVRSHCRAVMRKLEVADRRELWAALGRAAARPSAARELRPRTSSGLCGALHG